MQTTEAKILYNDPAAPGVYRMGLSWKTPRIEPGQFVMLRVSNGYDPLLRRPLAVYRVLGASSPTVFRGSGIEVLYNVVGRGTAMLSCKRAGTEISVLGPLGNGFPVHGSGDAVLVAGGMGIASFHMLARKLGRGTLLYGARTRVHARLAREFRGLGLKTKLATDDGSAGIKGPVTVLLAQELERRREPPVIYACGPAPMLRAAAELSAEYGAECLVSLERAMACGMGACLGCAIKTGTEVKETYRLVCRDGPVFDASAIDWERISP